MKRKYPFMLSLNASAQEAFFLNIVYNIKLLRLRNSSSRLSSILAVIFLFQHLYRSFAYAVIGDKGKISTTIDPGRKHSRILGDI